MSMCGPIVLNFAAQRSLLTAYQIGRMVAYTAVGGIVGAFGQTLLGSNRPMWLSGLSLALIASLLIINGYRAVMDKPLHLPLPKSLSGLSTNLWKTLRFSRLPKALTAAMAGTLTVLLPCGHLYSFLLGAVATGSPLKGAAFMFAFWLGSAPLLSVSSRWLTRVLRPKIKNGQRWAGALLVVAGLFSILSFGARTERFTKLLHEHQETTMTQNIPKTQSCH